MLARMRAGWIAPLAALLLAGCVSTRLSGPPEFDEEEIRTVAIGYFSHAENLGLESCPWDPVIEIDCWGGGPVAHLVVKEVLFGRLPRTRVPVSMYDVKRPKEFPLGRGRPVIVVFQEWGPLKYFQELAWTTAGELAVPVAIDNDVPELPCSADDLLEPIALEFRKPGPQRYLDEYPENSRQSVRASPHARIEGEIVHFTHGVTLAAIREAGQKVLTDPDHRSSWCLKE
jgi:hypothetical protein